MHYIATMYSADFHIQTFPPPLESFSLSGEHPDWSIAFEGTVQLRNFQSTSSRDVLVTHFLDARSAKPVEQARDLLVGLLQRWSDKNLENVSQRHFWKFFDNLHSVDHILPHSKNFRFIFDVGEACERALSPHVAGWSNLTNWFRPVSPAPNLFIDFFGSGHRHLVARAFSDKRDISLRSIRWVAEFVLAEIQEVEFTSVASMLSVARDTLKRKIEFHVRLRYTSSSFTSVPSLLPFTRKHIRCFLLHTGNPPPLNLRDRRMGAAGVLMPLGNAPTRLENGTICRRNYRGNLLHTFFSRHRTALVGQGAQDRASTGCRPECERRRCFWPDLSVAELYWKTRHMRGGKMVFDFRLGGRRGSFQHPTGAALGVRRACFAS